MDEFVEYGKFLDLDMASNLIVSLESNDLPFQIEDRRQRFQLPSVGNPAEDQIIIKVRKSDIEKINSIINATPGEDGDPVSFEHFLYTFSDEDLIEVIANQADWTKEEQGIANKIIVQKGISITADKIKNARKNLETNNKEGATTQSSKGSAGWFLLIAVLSIINTLVIAINAGFQFIFGLGITQIIDGLLLNSGRGVNYIGVLINISISSLFLVLYHYAKLKNSWAYITGMIFYGMDMLIFLFIKDWLGLSFHAFALIIIASGFLRIRKELVRNDE